MKVNDIGSQHTDYNDRLSLGGLIIFIMESPKIVMGPSDVLE
jgi:hypothetical protein